MTVRVLITTGAALAALAATTAFAQGVAAPKAGQVSVPQSAMSCSIVAWPSNTAPGADGKKRKPNEYGYDAVVRNLGVAAIPAGTAVDIVWKQPNLPGISSTPERIPVVLSQAIAPNATLKVHSRKPSLGGSCTATYGQRRAPR